MGEIADYYSWGAGAPEPDEYEELTNGRIYADIDGKPACANCNGNNIKTSNKGNLYCADLCWARE